MAEDTVRDRKAFDPMDPWRGVRDVYTDAWAKTMVDTVNSEAYAQATGTILDTYLTVSAPFREALEKAMLKTLEQLAMPSRADVLSIAERMINIEMRLDDLDAKLDGMQALLARASAGTAQTPRRVPQPTPKKAAKTKQVKKQAKRGKK